VDLDEVVVDYVHELLGDQAGEVDLTSARDALGDLGALAVSRLRRRIAEMLMAEGWQPPADAVLIEHDEPIVASVEEDRAVIRARAARARSDASRIRETSAEMHDASAEQMLAAMRSEVMQMRQALQTRATIEQAKGIVMARYGLSADSAWGYLVRSSQQRNIKLRDLAEDLVDSVAQRDPDGQSAPT
jgi:hypothetical protein